MDEAIEKYEELTKSKAPVIEPKFLEKGVFGEEGWSIRKSAPFFKKDND